MGGIFLPIPKVRCLSKAFFMLNGEKCIKNLFKRYASKQNTELEENDKLGKGSL